MPRDLGLPSDIRVGKLLRLQQPNRPRRREESRRGTLRACYLKALSIFLFNSSSFVLSAFLRCFLNSFSAKA